MHFQYFKKELFQFRKQFHHLFSERAANFYLFSKNEFFEIKIDSERVCRQIKYRPTQKIFILNSKYLLLKILAYEKLASQNIILKHFLK